MQTKDMESADAPLPDHGAGFAGRVAALLRADPRVAAARVTVEPDSGGRPALLAAIVPSPAWIEPARRQAESTQARMAIRTWARVFDGAYVIKEEAAAGPDYESWKSALRGGAPIPAAEMDVWRDQTVARIRALRPNHVLEIGCGVGVLVQQIAPDCASYRGTDISAEAIARLQAWASTQPGLRHLELGQRAAHELDDLPDGGVDTVIINSVVQYFPDHAYLERVLTAIAPKLSPGGHVFVGDVRDVRLLPGFNAAVASARAAGTETAGNLRRALHERVEKELAVDPHAFAALPFYAGARLLLRQLRLDNELTRYRYDVVLSTGAAPPGPAIEERPWTDAASLPVRHPGEAAPLRLRGIPNARLAGDLALLRLLQTAPAATPVAVLREQAAALQSAGLDPGELALAAEQRGHRAEAICGTTPDCFDLLLSDPASPAPAVPPVAARIEPSSDPSLPRLAAQLIESLRASILAQLPASGPLSLVAVPALPAVGVEGLR